MNGASLLLLIVSFSPIAVICCPARCNAGVPRRQAPRHPPRQPWCCSLSYQHPHRQEHKQPAAQKQGRYLLEKLFVLSLRGYGFPSVIFSECPPCANSKANIWVCRDVTGSWKEKVYTPGVCVCVEGPHTHCRWLIHLISKCVSAARLWNVSGTVVSELVLYFMKAPGYTCTKRGT